MIRKFLDAFGTFKIRHRLYKQSAMASQALANWRRMDTEYKTLQACALAAKLEADEALAMYAQAKNRELAYSKLLGRVGQSSNKNLESS